MRPFDERSNRRPGRLAVVVVGPALKCLQALPARLRASRTASRPCRLRAGGDYERNRKRPAHQPTDLDPPVANAERRSD